MGSTELRAAAQQALEAMRCAVPTGKITLADWYKSITALKAALAEPTTEDSPAVEPVAWMHTDAYNPKNRYLEWSENRRGYLGDWIKTPLYAAPLKRTLLTEEEIQQCFKEAGIAIKGQQWTNAVRAIERAYGIGGQP